VELQLENRAGEIQRLQRCINDLVSVLALPAIWTGSEPPQVVSTLLDALLGMLGLDLVYARMNGPTGEALIEVVRTAPSRCLTVRAQEIGDMLRQRLGDDRQKWPPLSRNVIDGTELSIVPLPLGLQGEIGVLIAGSGRADFPLETERLLLSVAANQASIALREAQLLGDQKQLAGELDRRVAQRTAELAAANEGLRKEVAERKRAEDAVSASARRLKLIINTIPALAWSARPDGSAEFFNQHYLDYVGLSAERAQDWGWATAIHPDDRDGLLASWQAIMASGNPGEGEARLRRSDGEYRWFLYRANPLRGDNGNIVKWYGINTDITDSKLAQDKLRESELNLRQLTETIPEMLWSATPDGAIDYCNAHLLDYTGFPAEEVMGSGWTKALHPDDVEQTAREWMSCVLTGAPYRVEVRTFHAADRTYRWCVANARPLRDQRGRILKWHGTVVDMHDWKQAQEALRNTQAELAHMARVMSIGELTAAIAHELNQPLSGIITNASTSLRMLAADPPNVDGALETARRTIRDANRASEVIARLRSLYSKKVAAVEPVDLNEAIRELIALSLSGLQKNGVIMRRELAGDLPRVTGDRVQLQQVVLNLLRNASDAMSAVDDRPRQLFIRTERHEGDRVLVTVQDTGVGFQPESADRLFDPFYTTKTNGMGIGLSVSRSIIESHHGRLWAALNEGPGATFAFSIPCGPEAETLSVTNS
jgi:PAS domain S-box-containing protein